MRFVAAPGIARHYAAAGLLLADHKLNQPPAHLTIVSAKADADARRLFARALQ